MDEPGPVPGVEAVIADAHRRHWGRVLAATARHTRDLHLAEDAVADAFAVALEVWRSDGVPASVEAWLLSVARRRAIDRMRRLGTARRHLAQVRLDDQRDAATLASPLDDDELRLVVLCVHPALSLQLQTALTLRLACGVDTEAVAAAFLVPRSTMAARLTRAKKAVVGSGVPLRLPEEADVTSRLPAVRSVVLHLWSLGHTTGSGETLRDPRLVRHAFHLARLLHRLAPRDPESRALLAVLLLHEARSAGRFRGGDQVLLEDADRSTWDRAAMAEGLGLLEPPVRHPSPLWCRAAIAAEHARALAWADTDWESVLRWYDTWLAAEPSATIALGRVLALAELRGPERGLADLDDLWSVAGAELEGYPYAHAARARFLTRLRRQDEALLACRRAEATARSDEERAYFAARSRA